MKNKQYQVIELFFYAFIVVLGVVLLFTGKSKPDDQPPPSTPTVLIEQADEEGRAVDVVLPNQ